MRRGIWLECESAWTPIRGPGSVPFDREFDASVIGFFLIAHFRGQMDRSCCRTSASMCATCTQRFCGKTGIIAGVNTLSELPPKLPELALLNDTVSQGTTFDDAEALAKQACLIRGTNAYDDFVAAACN
jgi:hypothetical protein